MSGRDLLAGLLDRELTGRQRFGVPSSYRHAFSCTGPHHAGIIKVDPDGDPCPPYSVTYNQVVSGCRLLTVGDEEGCVSIVDTSEGAGPLPTSLYTDTSHPPRAKWLAHNNTIFDTAWAKNDSVLYTASGDQAVGVWDTAAGRLRVYCTGHDGSVKVVCPHTHQHDMLASGSRDGGILLWDLRVPTTWSAARRLNTLNPVGRINVTTPAAQHTTPAAPGTTAAAAAGGGSGGAPFGGVSKARGRGGGGPPARRSVTSLLFLPHDGNTLVSSSDMDGTVKLWDLRSLTTPTQDITLPPAAAAMAAAAGGGGEGRGAKKGVAAAAARGGVGGMSVGGAAWLSFSCPGRINRPAGITSMALAPGGDLLLVSSIDSCHYLYRLSQLDRPPLACFTGHRAGSFCIKACFSPCGDYIISGSSDSKAYIWQVSDPTLPPVTLSGHNGEVTAVAWCPQDYCQLATAADDATIRVWSMNRSNAAYTRDIEQYNYSFADGQVDALWARFGLAGGDAAAEGGPVDLDQRPQPTRQEAAEGADQTAAVVSAAAAAGAGAGAGAVVEGLVPLVRANKVHQPRSICSPTTPQLPFWRARGPNAAAGAGAAATITAAVGQGVGPAHPQAVGTTGDDDVAAGVGSSQHEATAAGTAAAATAAAATAGAVISAGEAAAAGGGIGSLECGLDAATCFTPARQRCKGGPDGFTPPPRQHLTPTAAAAAAGAGVPPSTAKARMRSAAVKGTAAAKRPAVRSAVRSSGGLRQLTLVEQLTAAKQAREAAAAATAAAAGGDAAGHGADVKAAPKAVPQQQQQQEEGEKGKQAGDQQQQEHQPPAPTAVGFAVSPPAAAAAAECGGVFTAWMSELAPSPQIDTHNTQQTAAAAAAEQQQQVGLVDTTPLPAAAEDTTAAAAAEGHPLTAGTTAVKPAADRVVVGNNLTGNNTAAGVGVGGSSTGLLRGGVLEAHTPWSLPTPLRLQRQLEQAALEAQRLLMSTQQQHRTAAGGGGGGVRQGCSSSNNSRGVGLDSVDEGSNACRLLHDEFEVFCDEEGVGAMSQQQQQQQQLQLTVWIEVLGSSSRGGQQQLQQQQQQQQSAVV